MEGKIASDYVARCYRALAAMGAPIDDWQCVEVVDMGMDCNTCELCGCKKVRYIHVMRHKQFTDSVRVGCICAGIMEGDILAAEERDAKARRRSQRKSHYLKKQWTIDGEDHWAVRYKHRAIRIERNSFRGREYYTISIDGERYQWKDSRRMGSFLAAQHFVFEIIEQEDSGG